MLNEVGLAVEDLDAEIKAFEGQTKDDSALNDLKRQHAELMDRKGCASNRAIFEGRRVDLCTLEALKKCKANCDTTAISRRAQISVRCT